MKDYGAKELPETPRFWSLPRVSSSPAFLACGWLDIFCHGRHGKSSRQHQQVRSSSSEDHNLAKHWYLPRVVLKNSPIKIARFRWSGWWFQPTPLKKILCIFYIYYMYVSWDADISNIWKNKIHVPNHQPVYDSIWIHEDFLEHLGIFSIHISSCCIQLGCHDRYWRNSTQK